MRLRLVQDSSSSGTNGTSTTTQVGYSWPKSVQTKRFIVLLVVAILLLATLVMWISLAKQVKVDREVPQSLKSASLAYMHEVFGWAHDAGNVPWEETFASAWARWWDLESERRNFCYGRFSCLMSTARFEPAEGPRPMYTEDAEGNLVPTSNFGSPHPEPYVCDLRGIAIDYARLMTRFEHEPVVEARSYGSSSAMYASGSFKLGGCASPPVKSWRSDLSGRCKSSQILEHTSRALVALEVDAKTVECNVQDPRLTILVVRPAVVNLWEAHFALVEAVLRLTVLGLLPQPSGISSANRSQVILLPPDSANSKLFGTSVGLWQTLLGDAKIVAAHDVHPRAMHCYSRAVLLDFCCETTDLCPASSVLPVVRAGVVDPASEIAALPCARFAGGAGCAYGLFRYHFHRMLGAPQRPDSDPRIILVSRRTARNRRLEGEEKLALELNTLLPNNSGIDFFDFADMPIVDQARFVMSGDVLAGVHGAGLTLMIFLPRTSAVAEIALSEGWSDVDGPKGSPPMYREMAQRLGLGYVAWLYNGGFGPNYSMTLPAQVLASLIARALELR